MPMSPGDLPLASTLPPTEVTGGQVGTMPAASRGDHAHPRPTSVTRHVLDSNSAATVTYTRSFPSAPGIAYCVLNNTGRPVIVEGTDIITNGLYTGLVLKGSRSQPLPAVTAILTDLLKLAGFDPTGGSAAGVTVSITAILQTTPAP